MAIKCPNCQAENPDTKQFCGDCGTRRGLRETPQISVTKTLEATLEDLERGSIFARRYEIIEELGTGGMGRVFRAFDKKIDEEVAIKLLKPQIAANRKTVARFRNELRIARKISHHNVCRMYDLDEEGKTLYITMEYVRGEDLRSVIRRMGKLTVGKAVSIASQIAEGLGEAHKLGIIHRDLKPHNIMIDAEGNAKIMDFGIARSFHGEGITGEGAIVGTPEYMSPEQVEGKEADQRTDIYALGVILYEMVTSRAPFEGDTPLAVAYKHKNELPSPPKKLNPQIPDELNRQILRCLEKDRSKRYQSDSELRADLARIEESIPAAERVIPIRKPITSREITVKFSLKKALIPVFVLIVVIIAGIFLWRVLPRKTAAPVPSGVPTLAVLDFENISKDESLDFWRNGLSELMITGLSQSRFLTVLPGDRVYGILKKLGLASSKRYTTQDLIRIAGEGGISHVVTGSFLKAGDKIIITLTVQEPRIGKVIRRTNIECQNQEEIIAKTNELTLQVKQDLSLSPEQMAMDAGVYKKVEDVTTRSPEALKYYIEAKNIGEHQWKYEESNKVLEKAIALDPEFALAYLEMSINYSYLADLTNSDKCLEKARSLLNRVSEREYYLIQGMAASSSVKSIEIYQKLLALYPNDMDGNLYLGALYRNNEEWELALERFEKLAQLNPEDYVNYYNIAYIDMAMGMYKKARDILVSKQALYPNPALFHIQMATSYLCEGRYELALSEVNKAISSDPKNNQAEELLGNIYQIQGDLSSALKIYEQMISWEDSSSQETGRICRSTLRLMQGTYAQLKNEIDEGYEFSYRVGRKMGQFEFRLLSAYLNLVTHQFSPALEASHQAMELANETDFWYLKLLSTHIQGLIYARMKNFDEALKTAQKLKSLVDEDGARKFMRHYDHLRGEIEREQGKIDQAISSFNAAASLLPHGYDLLDTQIYFLGSLASAYMEKGDLEQAKKEYERVIALNTGRLRWGDQYSKSFYWLGLICERQDKKKEAVAYLKKFLDLWRDADPGLPELADARRRLSELK